MKRTERRISVPLCAVGAALLACASAAGCRRATAPSYWHACQCTYTTDFDQPGRHDVQVCAPTQEAPAVAQDCLRNEGVGAVEECHCGSPLAGESCAQPPSASPCRTGAP